MLIRVLLAAILAGVGAGVFATAAQSVKVTPLILEAETFENGGGGHAHGTPAAEAPSRSVTATGETEATEAEEWGPEDGFERTFYTLLANVSVGVGFALIFTAAILLAGQTVSLTSGVVWGLAGFVVFVLAPGIGLPPELPGTAAAGLMARQAWWLATVLATAGGLAILYFLWLRGGRQAMWLVAALVLIAAPHLYGAPVPGEHEMLVPGHLAVEFAIASIATGFVYWLFLGGLLGALLSRAMRAEADGGHLEAAA